MKLQAREKKFVIVALVAALVFLTVQFVILPQWDRAESTSERLFEAQKELRHSRQLIAARQLREQETTLRARLDEQNGRLLSAADANQGGAQFQTWLAAAATQQQLAFQRSEFLAPTPVGSKYIRIPVRLELTGRITDITQFLEAVTTSNRIVSIEEFDLNGSGDKDKQVRCGLVVAALMAKPK